MQVRILSGVSFIEKDTILNKLKHFTQTFIESILPSKHTNEEQVVIPEQRMYVIVRRDLSETYRMVQGAHALAQYALDHPIHFKEWNNQYLIYLSVYNLKALRSLINEFKDVGNSYSLNHDVFSVFYEPDLDNHETAVAIYAFQNHPLLKKLPLA